MTAGKETGAVHAPISKLGWAETIAPGAPLQGCTHPATRTERLPDGSWHYARVTCAICGRHLKWLPRPETVQRQRLNAFRLAKLAMRPDLSKWERSFVHHVSQQRKLSPRQQVLVERLCTQYLKGAP